MPNANIDATIEQVVIKATIKDAGPQGVQGPAGAAGADGVDGADGAPGQGLPPGGSTGQVLVKNSNTTFDTAWTDNTGGSGISEATALAYAVAL